MRREEQRQRQACGHIRAIAESPGNFNRHHADCLYTLLRHLPVSRRILAFNLSALPGPREYVDEHPDPREMEAAYIGSSDWTCGPYVITRTGHAAFIIRHREDVHAEIHPDEELLLTREDGIWHARLNRPRPIQMIAFQLYWGRQFVPWKKGV